VEGVAKESRQLAFYPGLVFYNIDDDKKEANALQLIKVDVGVFTAV
jgi:hypothetical protein